MAGIDYVKKKSDAFMNQENKQSKEGFETQLSPDVGPTLIFVSWKQFGVWRSFSLAFEKRYAHGLLKVEWRYRK